jgi:hypothetical protein
MSKVIAWVRQLVGNGAAATVGIGMFIVICLLAFCHRAKAGEIDFRAGSSFGTEGVGPVIGLQVWTPLKTFNQVNAFAGTLLWGSTTFKGQTVPNNWDLHAGFEGCHGPFCAALGALYLQRIDAVNGSHANFCLQLAYRFGWRRVSGIEVVHISNAGTTDPNIGRQAALVSFRLQ